MRGGESKKEKGKESILYISLGIQKADNKMTWCHWCTFVIANNFLKS